MSRVPYKALYIHIPFCVQKCAYCDFYSLERLQNSNEIDEYFEKLILDIRRFSKRGELAQIETVYLGGGTPSFVGMARLSSLLYMLSHSMRIEPDVEVTMEANPDSLTEAMVKDLWALGVNRLSIGVQSLDDTVLRILGRKHDAKKALQALDIALSRFDNVSVDVMCGIPGQSLQSFKETIEQLLAKNITHISVYPLSIEEGTLFDKLMQSGELQEPSNDDASEQMELAQNLLTAAGFHRYEVASYAKPGYECRHNLAYWSGVSYLGIGKSAVSMTQNEHRRVRIRDYEIEEVLDLKQKMAEDLMLAMRKSEGVSFDFVNKASEVLPGLDGCLLELRSLGLIEKTNTSYIPTQLGWLCGNELYERLYMLAP